MVKIKISCINSFHEAVQVISVGADIIELIVETKPGVDTRSKSKLEAQRILTNLRGKIAISILTDKTGINELLELLVGLSFHYLFPIHNLSMQTLKKIKQEFPQIMIVPTIHVVDKHSILEVEEFNVNPFIDLIHLDTKSQGMLGGTGKTHDWSISKEIVRLSKKPVILAGGLSPENVAKAISEVHPWCVDTYSGVLNDKKELDMEKVTLFIQNAKK